MLVRAYSCVRTRARTHTRIHLVSSPSSSTSTSLKILLLFFHFNFHFLFLLLLLLSLSLFLPSQVGTSGTSIVPVVNEVGSFLSLIFQLFPTDLTTRGLNLNQGPG